jgi:ERCC4-related helicase
LVARLEGRATLPATPFLTGIAGLEWEESELETDDKPERVATAANQLAMILRLTQITSGFVHDEHGGLYKFVPNPKMDAAVEFVDENIGEVPMIVWARYHADIDELMRRLAHHNPVQIDGRTGQKRSTRLSGMSLSDEAEDDFQQGRTRLLVGHPAAGGEGRNLQRAGVAVYYSQGYSLLHRVQSEGRNHRSGSEIHQKVTYVTYVCKDTVDETVMMALEGKKSVAEVVVDLKRQLGMRDNGTA